MGEWWDALSEAASGLGLGDMFSGLWDSASGAAGQFGQGAANFGSNLWQGAMQNPWGALGLGVQGAGMAMPYIMGGQQGQGGMDQGAMSQMQQPGGPTPQQMRRNLGDQQSKGLSGASPDFMASMAGVTPQELNQLLGYNPNGQGAT